MSSAVSQIEITILDTVFHIIGGPYRRLHEIGAPGYYVNMAAEIDLDADIRIPVLDFSVPQGDLDEDLMKILMAGFTGQPIYVGCMGGIGRTGLLIGLLYKLSLVADEAPSLVVYSDRAVLLTREHFKAHAIETDEQQDFIHGYDISHFDEFLDSVREIKGLEAPEHPREPRELKFTPPEAPTIWARVKAVFR